MDNDPVVIIGAGPAGLTAACALVEKGIRPLVLEKAGIVGGLARTEIYKGYRFDIGGHRFITNADEIRKLWHRMLGDDLQKTKRLSRIYFNGRFFNYPLDLFNTFSSLGVGDSLLILLSYLKALFSPAKEEQTFDQWVINRFGARLYNIFFKTYTEKVWGIPGHQIQANWAAQRIKGLSFFEAISNALLGTQKSKTLINTFWYPSNGSGMMWQRFKQTIANSGAEVRLNTKTIRLGHHNGRILSVGATDGCGFFEIPTENVISTVPLNDLLAMLDPPCPQAIHQASRKLEYRSLIMVGMIVDRIDLFPDQWIYVHSPEVKVGRIQNFRNWSAAMTPDPQKTNVGMEYFCSESDAFWKMSDAELLKISSCELDKLGLAKADEVIDGVVYRQKKAYPIYTKDYDRHLQVVRSFLGNFQNLQTIGRNGMHRYNNMDHSMLTGLQAAANLVGEKHDVWAVNENPEYLEDRTRPEVERVTAEKVLSTTFAKMDKIALAVAFGSLSGAGFFFATIFLLLKGGDVVGPHLVLLVQYFPGYRVTWPGAFAALAYGFGWGFLFGWLFAYLRNLFLALYVCWAKRKAQRLTLMDFFDRL